MPTTIPVQTDHYTDENSYPVKFLIDNEALDILSWQIPEDLDRASIRHEFDCVFFDGIEGWQLLMPKTLCVFIGRVVLHREGDFNPWWAFKGEISTLDIWSKA
jgi:hypothetical protein